MYKTVTVDVDVDIDLDDFDSEDLIEELERRGDWPPVSQAQEAIYLLYREWIDHKINHDDRFEKELRKFFMKHLDIVGL